MESKLQIVDQSFSLKCFPDTNAEYTKIVTSDKEVDDVEVRNTC